MLKKIRKKIGKLKILRDEDKEYFVTLEKPIIWTIILFLCSGILGFIFIESHIEIAQSALNIFHNLAQKTLGMTNYELFTLIFLNNSLKILVVAILGLLLGIVPIGFVVLNGFLIGMVAFLIQAAHNWTLFWVGILPHGIFEIPALLIGGAIGLKLGDSFAKHLKNKTGLTENLKRGTKFILRVVLPVLFFAAFVEVFISQILINMIK